MKHDSEPPPEPAFSGLFSRGVLLFLVALGVSFLLWRSCWIGGSLFDPAAAPRPIVARGDLAADEKATIELFQRSAPSVVYITTSRLERERLRFGSRLVEVPEGSGSGFVWDEEGHVVTNYHVIHGADAAVVGFDDRTILDARLVGVAPEYDLAVLHVAAPRGHLHPIPLGSSAALSVGQKVFAIGNPFGLDHTLTTGVISALDRTITALTGDQIEGVIQSDAAINPGNSGGPLLDSAGLLIGVNTAILSPSGASAGLGFSVPVDTVNRIVPRLIRGGSAEGPRLGVRLESDAAVKRSGLAGALVRDVLEGGAAISAGLRGFEMDERGRTRHGDLIVAIDGERVESAEDVPRILDEHQAGDVVRVSVVRDPLGARRELELEVTLREVSTLR